MEFNRKLLACRRKTKAFRANFEKLLAIAAQNKIIVMTASGFRVIDVFFIVFIIFRLYLVIQSL